MAPLAFQTYPNRIVSDGFFARSLPGGKQWAITGPEPELSLAADRYQLTLTSGPDGAELIVDQTNPVVAMTLINKLHEEHNEQCGDCLSHKHSRSPRVLMSLLEALCLYCEGAMRCLGAIFGRERLGRLTPHEEFLYPPEFFQNSAVRSVFFRITQDAAIGRLAFDHVS